MFPRTKNKHMMKKRKQEKFNVIKAKTERYKRSSIPYMTNLLNKHEERKRKICEGAV